MGINQTCWAIVNKDGKVETFIRLDLPEGWANPEGKQIIPDDELPENWEFETPAVPSQISARQIRLWLIKNNFLLSQVESAIASIEDEKTRSEIMVEWEYAPYIERSHPWLSYLANLLGLSEQDVDQAFIEASTI